MRIALVVPGGVDRSGRERVVPVFLNLIERLARRHSVCVFALHQSPGYEHYELCGATIVNIGRTAALPPVTRFVDRVLRLVHNLSREKPRFDVIHACFASGPGMLAGAAGRLLGIPVVTSSLGGEFVALPGIRYGDQRTRASRAAVQFALRSSVVITAPSRDAAGKCPGGEAVCVPMGVDCALFSPGEELAPGPPWRLVHVASLNRVKDQGTLLRAFRMTIDRGLDAYLEIVGEDILNGAVQRLAVELQIQDRVTFRGFVPNDALPAIYRRAHLYLHSSLHEGMPVSALEAAACGIPLVGSGVGLFRDLAPAAAIAVPPGNPAALADAVFSSLADPSLRHRISAAALRFAQRHDADWTASEFERLYLHAAYARGRAAKSSRPNAISKTNAS